MKIGIITQPLSRNYGGILQNYALQQTLVKLGYEPYTFDLGKFTWIDWIITTLKCMVKMIIGRPYLFPESPITKYHKEKYLRKFVENKICLIAPRCRRISHNKILKLNLRIIIVGSDQVWRPKYNYNIYDMYLGFTKLNIKRIAYAASFGTDQWEYSNKQTVKCKKLIHQFDAISVREDSAIDLCHNHFGVNAKLVLDPTLLLSVSEYNNLLLTIPPKTGQILFAYFLDISANKLTYTNSIANKLGYTPKIKSAGEHLTSEDSIEEWLSYFRDAKYIITDSFHGMVFSIIYNKEFMVIGNSQRGLSRFTSLLSLFSLEDRMITDIQDITLNTTPIDWQKINNKRATLQKESINFLLQNINF